MSSHEYDGCSQNTETLQCQSISWNNVATVENTHNNASVFDKAFFSDEMWIHRSGYINSQNYRPCSTANLHEFWESSLHPKKKHMVGHTTKTLTLTSVFWAYHHIRVVSGIGVAIYCFIRTRQTQHCLLAGWCNGAYGESNHEYAEIVFQRPTNCQEFVSTMKPDLTPPIFFCEDT